CPGTGVDHSCLGVLACLAAFPPVPRGVFHCREVPLEVHPDHGVPFVLGEVDQHPIPHETGVVQQHVQLPEVLDRLLNEVLRTVEVGDIVGVRDCLAAARLDLGDHLVGGPFPGVRTVEGDPHVVDDHLRPRLGEGERVGTADAAARAGHNDDSVLTHHLRYCPSLLTSAAARNAGISPPPWTASVAPETYEARDEARNTAGPPTSLGSANLPSGTVAPTWATPSSPP